MQASEVVERTDAPTDAAGRVLVKFSGVTKVYGLATVLDRVSFDIRRGEVHAVVGENGAGKSTLARILSGLVQPVAGAVEFDGRAVNDFSVRHAESLGIILIHQELALAEHLTVAENMFLGHELRRAGVLLRKEMLLRSREMLQRLGSPISPSQPVSTLSVSEKQIAEIAKALLRDAKLIIMDEPTAVLTPRESEHLFAQIDRLRDEGISIVFVSHKLDEVKRIADRVTVLRDARYQGTWDAGELSPEDIARLMVGRPLGNIYPERRRSSPPSVAMQMREFQAAPSSPPVSFDVLRGEILGVSGLIGAGRSELFEALLRLHPPHAGRVLLNGKPFCPRSYRDALAAGVAYITEDRKGRGLLLRETIAANLSLLLSIRDGTVLSRPKQDRERATEAIGRFEIDAPYLSVEVGRLSGGNQQKVLLAKSLLLQPDIIVVDEPTRGIDVGTRAQIYQLLRALADDGRAVVVISSDLQEIIGLSDRVLVMRAGHMAPPLQGPDINEQRIMQLATGVA